MIPITVTDVFVLPDGRYKCQVLWGGETPDGEIVPSSDAPEMFIADAADSTDHGKALHAAIARGDYGQPQPEPEFVEPVVIPSAVTRAQGKAALIQAGLWDGVVAYVAGITDPTEKALAEVALNDTITWRRSSPFLVGAATALGLDAIALDALFTTAAEIEL